MAAAILANKERAMNDEVDAAGFDCTLVILVIFALLFMTL